MKIEFGIKVSGNSSPHLTYLGDGPASLSEAFEISIAKWKYIAAHPDIWDDGSDATCGLCMLYFANECTNALYEKCPVYAQTGSVQCSATPYRSWFRAGRNTANKIVAAQDEVDFLARLYDKHKENDNGK
jgi:hypothetical protein